MKKSVDRKFAYRGYTVHVRIKNSDDIGEYDIYDADEIIHSSYACAPAQRACSYIDIMLYDMPKGER